jgi:AraC-like DNA-binding protein
MTEFAIKSSFSSSKIDPGLFIDRNTVRIEDETGQSLISRYAYESASLNITRFINRDDLLIQETIDAPVLLFQYCIAGEMELFELGGDVHTLKGGDCLVSVLKDHNSVGFKSNCRNSIASILLPLEHPSRLIDENLVERAALSSRDGNTPIEFSPFLPRERTILSEILDPPVAEPVRELFIESKMLELMAVRLSRLYDKTATDLNAPPLRFRKDELERVRFAGEYVAKKMDDPPTIARLARISGINEFKLKAGFKAVFGTTIYDYLRSIRLERAYSLIRDGELSVSEVAYRVGYEKPSHFSKLFRDRYGVNPGQVKKRRK